MLDLDAGDLAIVRDVLGEHLPLGRAFVFGSRARGTAKRFSDLDLVIQTDHALNLEQLGTLRSAFSESDLPINVDVVDWSGLDPAFQQMIEKEMIPIQP